MPNYLTHKLEFSPDPLSDTTPTYTDISAYLVEASWSSGKEKDLDDPQAGVASFRLINSKPAQNFPQRQFEPEYAASRFYPNIRPGRRFRWSITADGVTYPQGTWYATSWSVEYPAGTTYSEVVVTCSDGFWPLSLQSLPALDPPDAESFEDVAAFDQPFAHYPLNEETASRTMAAIAGPEGNYKGAVSFGYDSAVVGDNEAGVLFGDQSGGYARAALDDENVWHDSNGVTLECTVQVITSPAATRTFCGGPYDTTASQLSFGIADTQVYLFNVGAVQSSVLINGGLRLSAGTYHIALTYDGSTLVGYLNGAVTGTAQGSGDIISPDPNEFIYIGGSTNHGFLNRGDDIISQVVFYDYALSADRILAHANAALNRGYQEQLVGDRLETLATNALWTTSLPSGQIMAGPRMQTGQSILDEITTTVRAETPIGVFYFNDAANPANLHKEENLNISANFGDLTSETQYDSLQLVYDDEVFNQSTVSRDGGLAFTATDSGSISEFGTRTQDQTGLIIDKDSDAALISQAVVDRFSDPLFRIATIDLNGADQDARIQILTREIGDFIRVKRRGEGGTPIDVITRILGKSKTLTADRDLRCTWRLARGFNAATVIWRLGVPGYDELNTNAVLG